MKVVHARALVTRLLATFVLAGASVGVGATAAHAAPTTLRVGSTGTSVTTLQSALHNNKARSYFGYPSFTQSFGTYTNSGLRLWETANDWRTGVTVDGVIVVGSAEWNLLMGQRRSTAVRIDSRCLSGRVICASVQERKIRYYEYGRLLYTLDARYGRVGEETRSGNFYVTWKKVDVISNIYGSAMPYSIFFSGGQAVHLSASFAATGWYYPGSHGCINIRDKATLVKIYNRIRPGYDRVVVYNK